MPGSGGLELTIGLLPHKAHGDLDLVACAAVTPEVYAAATTACVAAAWPVETGIQVVLQAKAYAEHRGAKSPAP